MAAKTKRKTATSIRKAHDQRERAGRAAVGGRGVECGVAGTRAVTGRSGLGKGQLACCRVIVKNLGVASPLDGGLKLAALFVLAEMLVDKIVEKFVGKGAVGFGFQRLLHLAEQRDVGKHRFAKDGLAVLNVGLCKFLAFGSDDRRAFFEAQEAEKNGGVDGRKKGVDFEAQLIG